MSELPDGWKPTERQPRRPREMRLESALTSIRETIAAIKSECEAAADRAACNRFTVTKRVYPFEWFKSFGYDYDDAMLELCVSAFEAELHSLSFSSGQLIITKENGLKATNPFLLVSESNSEWDPLRGSYLKVLIDWETSTENDEPSWIQLGRSRAMVEAEDESAWSCPVCLELLKKKHENVALVGCGHLLCQTCEPNFLPCQLCPVCRQPILSKQRIFV